MRLSDTQAHDLILIARRELGDKRGATKRADAALLAAKRALDVIALGMLYAMEAEQDGSG